MNPLWAQLALVVTLMLLNAAFAGTEIALVTLREGRVRRLEQHGRAGRALARLSRDPNQYLATIQIGITLGGFLASAVAAVSLARPLVGPLSFLGGAAQPVAIVLVTVVLTYFTLVIGELAPKRVAMQRAERWALVAARPLALLSALSRPAVWLLSHSTDVAVRFMGGDPRRKAEEVTEEELHDLVKAQSTFTPAQRTIIAGAFEISERTLREVLVPRRDVLFLDRQLPVAAALDELIDTGHSRAPVIDGDADQVIGVVHWRDLMTGADRRDDGSRHTVGDQLRETVVLPETVRVDQALRALQSQRQQLAVVLNEHGGTEGIVTIEDLIEELVGEIYDETDPDVASVRRETDGSMVVPGSFPIHDLPDIGVELPGGDYATVAGLVLERLGRLPEKPGDTVQVDAWTLEVLAIERRAITRIRIRLLP